MLDYTIISTKSEIYSDYLKESLYNLLDRTFEFPINGFKYNVFEVSEKYVARPDLIAYDAYNNASLADLICKINGISNPFELNKGTLIILPRPEYIDSFYVQPKQDDLEGDPGEGNNIPEPKSKSSQKRKANEAVTGDKRFRIDTSNGIIIY